MNGKDFNEVVNLIAREDRRYDRNAYIFVRRALDHTLKRDAEAAGERRHVNGRELCEGIREFALEQYGPMTFTLFENWGVRRTDDFGEIVFKLVDYGIFGKTPNDHPDDFRDVYDFRKSFLEPFEPRSKRAREPAPAATPEPESVKEPVAKKKAVRKPSRKKDAEQE